MANLRKLPDMGEKSDDPLSPAYVPSIFSFTTNDKERKAPAYVQFCCNITY